MGWGTRGVLVSIAGPAHLEPAREGLERDWEVIVGEGEVEEVW